MKPSYVPWWMSSELTNLETQEVERASALAERRMRYLVDEIGALARADAHNPRFTAGPPFRYSP